MAKLVDALVSGTSDRKVVQVRVLFRAQITTLNPLSDKQFDKGFLFRVETGVEQDIFLIIFKAFKQQSISISEQLLLFDTYFF